MREHESPTFEAAFGLPSHLSGASRPARGPDGAPELAGLIACMLFGLAWLLPNHYSPWPAFHSDGLAALGLLIASAGTLILDKGPARWPFASLVLAVVAVLPLLQHAAGLVLFFGDALIASLYVAGFALALQAGATLQARARSALVPLLVTTLVVALLSADIATLQWLRVNNFGVLVVDMEREGRPYANLAQPNQFATLLVLGLVAAFALHDQRRLSTPALVLSACMLLFGVVMSQSRAGFLEVAVVIAVALAMNGRAALRVGRAPLLALGALLVVLVLGWPTLCGWLYLPSVRDGTMGTSNGRVELWRELLVAVARAPWAGWGWNQVSVAQAAVAGSLPPFRLMVEHAHSLVIDLLLWNGVPIGLALIAAGLWWLVRHVRACRDGETAWLLAALIAFAAHALVEFPHDYAYLLFPVGLVAGAIEASSGAGRFVALPRPASAVVPAAGLAMLVWVSLEYVAIEDNYRDMRFEQARIGTAEVSTSIPPLVLLTQLREFLVVARHQVAPGMAAADLERLRRIASRYPYPPVLLRHALAEALNGHPQHAAEALRRLCHLHVEERCIEGLDSWAAMAAGTWPQIAAVPLPPRPVR